MDRIQRGEQLAVRYSGPFGATSETNPIGKSAVAFVGGGIAVCSSYLI